MASRIRVLGGSLALVAGAALALSGCAASSSHATGSSALSGSKSSTSAHPSPSAKAKPKRKHYPSGPPIQLESIAPLSGTTVGVAMPISIVFTNPVKASARKAIENHISITTSSPVTGAWHWFDDRRVDFRPKTFWKPGTTVSMVAHLDHVGDGYGRYGTHGYTRQFTIGADVHTYVHVRSHTTVVKRNGVLLRTMPSDAGSPQFESWDGTMGVVEKLPTIRMTSCSVHIACSKKNPNYYDITLPWDVRLTWSGTFVHYSTGDPYPGHSYGSHGCVHLSYANAEWFYHLVHQGDPVTVMGSPRGDASGDNGYADYNLTWSQWLASSGRGAFTTRT